MIPPVDPAAVEQVAALLDYNGATGGVADRDVAAMLRALSAALTQAQEERDRLKVELSNALHAERMCFRDLGRIETQLETAHQHLGAALESSNGKDKPLGYFDRLYAARAYYEKNKL